MAFEWQPREKAAETLEVDLQTLQAWIDSGHAPSRERDDRIEVLIEFPDEPDEAGDEDETGSTPAPEEEAAEDPIHVGDAEPLHSEPAPHHHPIDLVSKRELQMAGGMVAAWQRLAETSDHELTRSRRFGVLAWSLVAALVVLGGVGIWWATRTVSDTQNRASLTEYELNRAAEQSTGDRDRISELEQNLSQIRAQLIEAEKRADVTAARNEELAEQHRLARQRIDTQAESDQTLAAALRDTVRDQRERIENLEQDLSEARQELTETRRRLTDALQQLDPEQTP